MMPAHLPDRPSWHCHGCGKEWPCATARAELIEEHRYDGTALRIYLLGQMQEAIAELGGRPDAMFERFLQWASPVNAEARREWSRTRRSI
jgi:hypothetical protein